jgi:hypothetical protein
MGDLSADGNIHGSVEAPPQLLTIADIHMGEYRLMTERIIVGVISRLSNVELTSVDNVPARFVSRLGGATAGEISKGPGLPTCQKRLEVECEGARK